MEFTAYSFIYDICLMSLLLFIAQLLRSNIRFFQYIYMPSSLIAGLLGLLLYKFLPFSNQANTYPYLFICILFSGLFIGKNTNINFKKIIRTAGNTFYVNMASELLGFGTALFFGGVLLNYFIQNNAFRGFELLQPAGFTGGHGYAAAIGTTLNNLLGRSDCVYIGQTFATIGLLVGVFGGIIIINFAIRHKATRFIDKINYLPDYMLTGKIPETEQRNICKDTIHPMTMETFTFHFSLIFIASGLGFLVYNGYKQIDILSNFELPLMCLTMLSGIFVQFILVKFNYLQQVDRNIINKLSGSITDYLVAFGVATIRVDIVMEFWFEILLLSLLGIVWAVFMVFYIGQRFFYNFWFERSIFVYGYITGVVAIGIVLLQIVDPQMKSNTLDDFGTAYTLQSIIEIFLVSFTPFFVISFGSISTGVVLISFAIVLLYMSSLKYGTYNIPMNKLRKDELNIIEELER